MKRKYAAVPFFLLALTSFTSNDLRNSSNDGKQDSAQQDSSKPQGGNMTPDGVYVPPSRQPSTVDLEKFLPRRSKSPE